MEKITFSTSVPWDLIKIIAQTISRDPRLSMKELVENALDAFSRVPYSPPGCKLVKVEIRKKDRSNPHIRVVDNGAGWNPHKDPLDPCLGRPDFEYTVQHIGESIKKKWDQQREKGSAVGQFGIGMLSFWALGERLTVYSRPILDDGKVGPCSLMVWFKDKEEAEYRHDVDPPAELAKNAGSVIIIDGLEKAQTNLITGNILARYLSRASRTLLKNTGASLEIDDHGVVFPVIPKKYEGVKFPVEKVDADGFGQISMEIYASPPVESPEEFRVPVFKEGAPAYHDITELPELNLYPWNAKKIYGEVNYPFGTLAPSRTGFVNDQFLEAFVKTMKDITAQLAEFVDRVEAQKKARQKDKFYAIFREKWEEIFKQLPEEWQKKVGPGPPPPPPPPPVAGPMYRVEISPANPKIAYRDVESLTARPYDIDGNILRDVEHSLIYSWQSIGKNVGNMSDDMKKTCHFQAGSKQKIGTLKVTVLQYIEGKDEPIIKKATTNVFIVPELKVRIPPPPSRRNAPPVGDDDDLGEDGPHSKYDENLNTITVNNHHKDWIAAERKDSETLYRYFNFCYAKEIAVDRWKFLDSHELSEKIMDIVAMSERTFDWKDIVKQRRRKRRLKSPTS
jgi:hypothetical protein